MKFAHVLLSAGLALSSASVVMANELDPVVASLPRQLVVKVDEKTGEKTIFKTYSELKVAGDKDAAAVLKIAEEDGEVVSTQAMNELDRDSSQAAWYHYYQPNNWNYNYGYSYGYYGSYYSYTSYYSYNYSGCNYYYYWY